MKKAFKSALSLLLCMIMVVSAFPISTFAEEGTDIDSDLAYSTGNAMGKIVNILLYKKANASQMTTALLIRCSTAAPHRSNTRQLRTVS